MKSVSLGWCAAALAAVLIAAPTVADDPPTYPESFRGVMPEFWDTGPGGNVECSDLAIEYEFASDRFDEGDQLEGTFMTIQWGTDPTGTFVDWEGEHGGMAVILKGGNGAHVYYYGLDPYYNSDSYLASPPVGIGNIPQLSNITFCYNPPEEEEEGEWCSPGYWRQTQHLDSWEATGYDPDEKYSDVFGSAPPKASNPSLCLALPSDPTLWDVLQYPQCYGAEAFNAIGDLLSEAHPDVDFQGDRVEDSCPLD